MKVLLEVWLKVGLPLCGIAVLVLFFMGVWTGRWQHDNIPMGETIETDSVAVFLGDRVIKEHVPTIRGEIVRIHKKELENSWKIIIKNRRRRSSRIFYTWGQPPRRPQGPQDTYPKQGIHLYMVGRATLRN